MGDVSVNVNYLGSLDINTLRLLAEFYRDCLANDNYENTFLNCGECQRRLDIVEAELRRRTAEAEKNLFGSTLAEFREAVPRRK